MRISLSGLHPRLVASIILPFAVLMLALAVSGIEVYEGSLRRIVAERDQRAAGAAAAAVSEELAERAAAVRQLGLRLLDGVDAGRAVRDARAGEDEFSEGLAVVSPAGRIAAGTLSLRAADAQALEEAVATPGAQPLLRLLADGGETVVLAVYPARPLAVVGAFTLLPLLREVLPDLDRQPSPVSAAIVDRSTGVLARVGAAWPDAMDPRVLTAVGAAFGGTTGFSYVRPAGGAERVLAFSPVGSGSGWALVIGEPWQSVASPALRLSLFAPVALAMVVVISLLGLWLTAREVIVPLRQLRFQALRMAAGDFEGIGAPIGGVREIRELHRSMTVMAHRIRSAQQSLRRYVGKVTSAQEEERRRLARELHDETIQDLIALDQKVQLVARDLGARQGRQARDLDAVHHEARQAIERVRRLSLALRPAYLEDLGLLPALEALARDVGARLGIAVVLRVRGRTRTLPPEVDLSLYRIVQEALANVARHASARHASVLLRFGRDELALEVRDDGVGFVPPREAGDLTLGGHFGLVSVRERAESIGAHVGLQSAPGAGTLLTLRAPLPRG